MTFNEIKAFQRKNGLVADGIMGPKTKAAMNGNLKAPPPLTYGSSLPPAIANTSNAVVDIPIVSQPSESAFSDSQLFNNGKSYNSPKWDGKYAQPTGVDSLQNSYNEYTGTGNYIDATGTMTGGLGNYGTYQGVGIDQGAYDTIKSSGVTEGLSNQGGLASAFSAMGGAKGLSDTASAFSTIYGMYNDYQANKRADKVLDAQMADRTNQYKANKTFNDNIAASGLGTSSRAVM